MPRPNRLVVAGYRHHIIQRGNYGLMTHPVHPLITPRDEWGVKGAPQGLPRLSPPGSPVDAADQGGALRQAYAHFEMVNE